MIELLQRGRAGGHGLQDLPLLGSEYQALPELDANANAVAIEHLKLETKAGSGTPRFPNP